MTPGVRSKTGFRSIVLVAILLSVPACISPPVQEMSNARQAIAAAEEAGALNTAPEVMEQAQRFLNQAEQRLQNKQFRDARRSAIAAKLEAIRALQTADDS